MTTIKRIVGFLDCWIAALVMLILGSATTAALAQGASQSFNATNVLASGIVLTTWPTNGVGTNTGAGINVANYPSDGFYFAGNVGAVGTATVQIVRSPYSSAPTTNWHYETVSPFTFTIPMPATGPYMFVTNVPDWIVRPGNWVGISLMTNVAGVVSNLDVGLTKKLIPVGTR